MAHSEPQEIQRRNEMQGIELSIANVSVWLRGSAGRANALLWTGKPHHA